MPVNKKLSVGLVTALSMTLLFGNFQEASASSGQTDVSEKIDLYKLESFQDVLDAGDNEVTYYWKDASGVEQTVDLTVTLDGAGQTISSVEEENITSANQLDEIQESIEQSDATISSMRVDDIFYNGPAGEVEKSVKDADTTGTVTIMAYDEVPYKLNGGDTRSQFANDHSFDRHKYLKTGASTCSRTRYAQNVGVSSVRTNTVNHYDEKLRKKQGDNSYAVYYNKRFDSILSQMTSTDDVRTKWHRVTKVDGVEETHHPLCQ